MPKNGSTRDIFCKQCSNCCCAQIEVDGDDVVVNAYRIIPGRVTPQRLKYPACRSLAGLLGMDTTDAIKKSSGV